jgi:hypothetical protein
VRYLYWHPETRLLDRRREELFAASRAGNIFLTSRQKAERQHEGTPFYITRDLADRHLTRPGSACFPLTLNGFSGQTSFDEPAQAEDSLLLNLSAFAREYLQTLGIFNYNADQKIAELLWMHAVAIGYSPIYLTENADGIRQDWPRIPLPDSKAGLLASAELGRQVAALLDVENPIQRVISGGVRTELRSIAVISRLGGGSLNSSAGDLSVTVGWGHPGRGGITMPGQGKIAERQYLPDELVALEEGAKVLGLTIEQVIQHVGETTCDVYLNDIAYWKNIPAKVWDYTIGGYQVIKKWLSYRERNLLGRSLSKDEAREVMDIACRIAAILLLEPALDANYKTVKQAFYVWPTAREYDGHPAGSNQ